MGFHVCWPTSSPRVCITRVVRCPQGLPSPTWEGGGPGTAPWPQQPGLARSQKPLEGWSALCGLPHLPSLWLLGTWPSEREPEPPAQRRLRSSRRRARPGGRPGDGICAQAVSGAAAACVPGGPVGPGLSLTGTCASDRRRGRLGAVGRARAGSPPAEAGEPGLHCGQAPGSPEGSGSSSVHTLAASTACLPHSSSPAPPRGSFIGRGSSPPQIYFQHPDDRFRAAWAVLHSLLISAWTGCPALAPLPRVCRPGVCVWAPRLSARGQVGVLPLGVIS